MSLIGLVNDFFFCESVMIFLNKENQHKFISFAKHLIEIFADIFDKFNSSGKLPSIWIF